jgi:prepilin-type N-terminal cleavage/methylation domain-containing protein
MTAPAFRFRTARRGFTLMEALITLSITALLMLAMGSAFIAAGSTVEANDRFFRSVQQARVAMDLVTTEVRRCQSVASASATSITLTAATTDFNGDSITFTYNTSGQYAGELTLTDNTAGTTTVLATNLVSASFANYTASSVVKTISLVMDVEIGTTQVVLSGSAAPRSSVSTSSWN